MVAASALTVVTLADNIMLPHPPERKEPVFKSEKARENYMRISGGMLEVTLPGKPFVFVDMRADTNVDVRATAWKVGNSSRIRSEYMRSVDSAKPYDVAKKLCDAGVAGAVTVIYDGDATDPILVAYPENRTSLVNVTPIKSSNYEKRLIREMWRGYAYAAGGTSSPTDMCVMQQVLSLADLDAIQCDMAYPGVTGQIVNNAGKFGFAKIMKGSYRGACKQGWAPPPTNEYQRAIWEATQKEKAEATKEPTAPLKIKFDKNKGK